MLLIAFMESSEIERISQLESFTHKNWNLELWFLFRHHRTPTPSRNLLAGVSSKRLEFWRST